jgi:poly-gamma-glutamate synthesis protein (capsule biosynthesis protein)
VADKKWHFKGDGSYAKILPASSVEVALLSNTHSSDYLEQGFNDTVSNLRSAGVNLVYENTPYITEINGVEVVIIGDSSITGENTTVTGSVSGRVMAEIKKYKKDGNIVIVDMHWGAEYTNVPTSWQTGLARSFIDAGADLIVGQHPHVLQGIEVYNGKYIVYSLGNFAFGGNCLAKYKETFLFRISFVLNPDGSREYSAKVVPCFISSSAEVNSSGVLWNNFQPVPVTGADAEQVMNLIYERSAALPCGITDIGVFDDA